MLESELVDDLTGGEPKAGDAFDRGRRWHTQQGERLVFIADADLTDKPSADDFDHLAGTLYFPTGVSYRIERAVVTRIVDRHGNTTKLERQYDGSRITALTVTDPLGRVTSAQIGTGDTSGTAYQHTLTWKGFDGASRTVAIKFATMWDPNAADIPTTWGLLPTAHVMTCVNATCPVPNLKVNPYVLKELVLPDGRSYTFQYNAYAELGRITLPTGAKYEYDWGPASIADKYGVVVPAQQPSLAAAVYRRVRAKRVYADGTHVSATTVFDDAVDSALGRPATRVTVSSFDGDRSDAKSRLQKEQHLFYEVPSSGAMAAMLHTFYYSPWREGLEAEVDTLSLKGSDTLLTRRNTWEQAGRVRWWNGADELAPALDTRLASVKTILDDGERSHTDYAYDDRGNPIEVSLYDFESHGGAHPIKRSRTRYLDDAAYVTPPAYLPSLPVKTEVFAVDRNTGAETLYSATRTEYDVYTGAGHAPLVRRDGITGHNGGRDQRGNPTAVLTEDVESGAWIASYTQYDIAGNPVATIDPLGRVARNEYDDNYGSPDGDADHGSSGPAGKTFACATRAINKAGHQVRLQFDLGLLVPVDVRGPDGITTSSWHKDKLDRPTRSKVGSFLERSIGYDDATPGDPQSVVIEKSDFATVGDQAIETRTIADGLGRATAHRTKQADGSWLESRTGYDGLGRAVRRSSPRPVGGGQPPWTVSHYDGLGRTISIATPDGATLSATHSGTTTTTTDASGRSRQMIADVLGRTVAVVEAPGLASFAYRTDYDYDLGGNLVRVRQGSQTRSFKYDGLGRLVRERIPERDANPALSLADPVTGNASWDTAYEYDAGNRMVRRTDARGVTTTHHHDALDRLIETSYSDGTPRVTFEYDGGGVVPFGFGRPWRHTVDGVVQGTVTAYDELGRPMSQSQAFFGNGGWGAPFTHERGYTASGAIKSERYPSGHTITYGYDAIGRPSSVVGNLGDGTVRTYASQPAYDERGRVIRRRLGSTTPVFQHFAYNDRDQLVRVAVGTSDTASAAASADRGELTYCYTASCTDAADNAGVVERIEQTVPAGKLGAGAVRMRFAFDLDPLYRVAGVKVSRDQASPFVEQHFGYDRYGNRSITSAIGASSLSLPTSASTNRIDDPSVKYDAAGNVVRQGARALTYDAENRLVRIDEAGVVIARYAYDADGRRVVVAGRTSTTRFVTGIGGAVLAEYTDGASAPQREHAAGIVADAAGPRWLIGDHVGSPRIIVAADGALASTVHRLQLPYGEDVAVAGLGDDGAVKQRFTSYDRDDDTGLDYAMSRYYASAHGRFLGVDAALSSGRPDDPQTWNRYAYVGGRPTMTIDPSGAFWEELGDAVGRLGKGAWNGFEYGLVEAPKDVLLSPYTITLNAMKAYVLWHYFETGEMLLDVGAVDKSLHQLNAPVLPTFEVKDEDKDLAYYTGYAGGVVASAFATDAAVGAVAGVGRAAMADDLATATLSKATRVPSSAYTPEADFYTRWMRTSRTEGALEVGSEVSVGANPKSIAQVRHNQRLATASEFSPSLNVSANAVSPYDFGEGYVLLRFEGSAVRRLGAWEAVDQTSCAVGSRMLFFHERVTKIPGTVLRIGMPD